MNSKQSISESILNLLKFKSKIGKSLLLTGSWGAGKTYLWENEILPELKKNSEVIVISQSCFGIDSLEVLKNKIFTRYLIEKGKDLSKNEISKKLEFLKRGWSYFGKRTIKLTQDVLGKNLFNISLDPFEIIDNNIVICFDDIERKSNGLSLAEIFGFINFLVEKKACNIIIITNEMEMIEDDKKTFDETWEKSVNQRICIQTNMDELYDVLVDKHHTEKKQAEYLIKIKSSILGVFLKSKETNLRTLIRVMNSILELQRVDLNLDTKHYVCLTAYIIELTRGNLSKRELDFYNFKSSTLHNNYKSQNQLSEKEKQREIFLTSYFISRSEYVFYESIYDYIRLGYPNIEAIKDELFPPLVIYSPLEMLIKEIAGIELYFKTEKEVQTLIKQLRGHLESHSWKTAKQVLEIIIYIKHLSQLIGVEVERKVVEKVNLELKKLAKLNDQSFDRNFQFHYSSMRELWIGYYEEFISETQKTIIAKVEEKAQEIIFSKNELEFYNITNSSENSCTAIIKILCNLDISQNMIECPYWWYIVLEHMISTSKNMTHDYKVRNAELLSNFYEKIKLLGNDPRADKMQLVRVNNLQRLIL